MYFPLCVTTDHTLLKSMIKIKSLIEFCKHNSINICGICDENMFGVIEFYNACLNNNIKPVIGINVKLNDQEIYLYTQNYSGYQNLLKINTFIQTEQLNIDFLEKYSLNIICVIPFNSKELYNQLKEIYEIVYISYSTNYEKNNALVLTDKIVFMPKIKSLTMEDSTYLNYLSMINNAKTINECKMHDYSLNSYYLDYTEEDIKTTIDFSKLINIVIPKDKIYIPKYKNDNDSYTFLAALANKGLSKRLNNEVDHKYLDRLNYELNVIKEMNFSDYFLIVYDYILYAKKNNILVGPGRGSAAGSLVAYSLGITDIDPLKYNLLFERFLNKERVTMPDIDVDFEDTKRHLVIEYLKEKYGLYNVANIMTYSNMTAKQVLRDVAKILEIEENELTKVTKLIDPKATLQENLNNQELKQTVLNNTNFKNMYKIALKLEGIKRQISTHAAGVVISSEKIDNLIPIVVNTDNIMTGCTMEYLEDLGLIKMDLLAIRNLRTIKDILDLIKENYKIDLKLSEIPLDDSKTLDLFKNGNTMGIFQFESEGMKSVLKKLKPSSFSDIIATIALYRPGPMDNINEYIARKNNLKQIDYLHPSLENILKETYGIIIYQEQIMQILVKMGNYSYFQADNIRRAMSKKKKDVMLKEREIFIAKSKENNYSEETAIKVYDLIVKFANYGFNKSHSVAYALIGYQMGYLKVHYSSIFYTNLLNMSIGSEIKTNEYLNALKQMNIKLIAPSINYSSDVYTIKNHKILLPFGIIKNFGNNFTEIILKERQNGIYLDFTDFVKRTFNKGITKKAIEVLIYSGAFNEFELTKNTLLHAIDNVIDYALLTKDIDSPLILKPRLENYEELNEKEIIDKEKEIFGFYITNHPASKYIKNIVKINNVENYFDKFIKCVILVDRIYNIKTKKNETMSFITGEDETGILDFIIFPNKNNLLTRFKKDDLVLVSGKVEKRIDKYQVIVSNLEKIK